MKVAHFSPRGGNTPVSPDPQLLRYARHIALAGMALVLVWPAARGYNAWIGWLPLWLLGMPAAAWWSLHRFRLPAGLRRPRLPRRRRTPQARRTRKLRTARWTQVA
ncbi:hypothetical protein [Stenotrophomonas sp. YIM B06876]|uniref:hypothetical protein n=1 Tax=Stenotrophomonas sp. YIM B06876 TaxID=3060211 RepID=UPI002738E00D|nr:hypothetical protein [Stenotrophomonas sp. YIM B06876]